MGNRNKSRREDEKTYQDFYEFRCIDDRLKCVYCDFSRQCLDHVPPISVVRKIGLKKIREESLNLFLLPSCNACNLALSSRPLGTYGERLSFLYSYYSKKIESKTLWGEDEIEELSGNLKMMIAAKQKFIRQELIARIRSIEFNMLDVDSREAQLDSINLFLR